jgi:hypothetical protein
LLRLILNICKAVSCLVEEGTIYRIIRCNLNLRQEILYYLRVMATQIWNASSPNHPSRPPVQMHDPSMIPRAIHTLSGESLRLRGPGRSILHPQRKEGGPWSLRRSDKINVSQEMWRVAPKIRMRRQCLSLASSKRRTKTWVALALRMMIAET